MNSKKYKIRLSELTSLKFMDLTSFGDFFRQMKSGNDYDVPLEPFKRMVQKEITDHIRNWRFIILFVIIALACLGTLFSTLADTAKTFASNNSEDTFFFLNLFTKSNGTLPSFYVFIGFLGPLFGIGLGFDAISSEQNKGTLSRIMAQPIPRDYIINAKFLAGIIVISVMLLALSFLVLGAGLVAIGIPPTVGEFIRIIIYTSLSITYISFWLNLSILFSVRFKQSATSALSCIAVWLFFTIFYPLIVNVVTSSFEPSKYASQNAIFLYQKLKYYLVQIMPNELFDQITSAILIPSIRSLGPLTMEQIQGAIPSNLSLGQSILLVWPQITGLISLTLLCFLFSYVIFMKQEIRSRG
jgi:ABC-2 type transport system permease protein